MLEKLFKAIFTIIGVILGYLIGTELIVLDYFQKIQFFKQGTIGEFSLIILSMLICGLILFLLSPLFTSLINKVMQYIENNVQKVPSTEIIFGTIGVIIGLLMSTLFFSVIRGSSIIWNIVAVVVSICLAVIGANIAIRKREEIMTLFSNMRKSGRTSNKDKDKKNKSKSKVAPKILDTSVIIDGRILDICQTGFIEGHLVIPHFVLEELRHIADSSDDLKRNRGRRGLDILNKIQKDIDIPVELTELDFPNIAEVDSKLLKLAQVMDGKVLTNDYNLNKVAKFQGVVVLNINELANAIKPIVLPGEEMNIQIVKDGKESGQGVAYLDDGTMIVVEGGRKFIGKNINVIVTSVLQTAAGRMIFAKKNG